MWERAMVDDERLAVLRRLADPAARRSVEGPGGVVVAEGRWVLEHAVAAGLTATVVLVEDRLVDEVAPLLAGLAPAPVLVGDRAAVRAVTGFDFHRGVIAALERPAPLDPAELLAPPGRRALAVLEGVNDHENLGAVCRSARALGVDGVLLDPTSADHLYRRAIRVSMGHVLRLPVARATTDGAWTWPLGALRQLGEAGFTTVALTPDPGAEDVAGVAGEGLERVALLLGAEGPGLGPDTLAAADRRVRIPLAAGADSLNLAAAAAVAFHRLVPPPS